MKAESHSQTARRIQALESYRILDTPAESVFDDLTRLAAQICGVSYGAISLIDQDRQWFKSRVGIKARQGVRRHSFCTHAIREDEILVIPDAQQDERFVNNPWVIASPHIRFYAGAVLRTPEGIPLGTLCVFDDKPRELSAEQRDALLVLARQVMAQLELRRAGRQDAPSPVEKTLQEDASVLETLIKVGADLTAELDLERLLQKITDAATKLTGAAFGALFYNAQNEQGEIYQLYTLSGAPREAFERYPAPRNTDVFAPTFRGEGIVRSADITQDPRYGKNAPHKGLPEGHLPVRSYLAVPVISRAGEVIGGLLFGHPEPGVFTELSERLASGIAAQAAIAIDNARLYKQAKAELAERERTQEALRESEREYRFLAESIPQMVWTAGPDGEVDYVNARWREYTATPPEAVSNWNWREHLHSDDVDPVTERWLRSVQSGEPYSIEMRLRRHDGEYRWFLTRAECLQDEHGRAIRWFGTATDIEESKRAEQRIKESEARYRTLLETIPQLVWNTTPQGYCEYASEQWRAYTGLPEQDILGYGWREVIHPEDREQVVADFGAALRSGEAYNGEFRIRSKQGDYCWFKSRGLPLRNERGDILSWFGTCTDITDIVRAREIQAADQARLEQLVEQRTRQLKESSARLLEEVQERERAEEALRQAHKMEAIGQLTGGVAHDFNNLLQVIGANLQLLERHLVPDEQAKRRLETAAGAVERGARLASQLLAFARRQPLEPRSTNLGRVLKEVDDLLRRALGEDIKLEMIIAGGLWNTFIDPAQVENAILNLALNARDAMSQGGKLTVEARNAVLDSAYAAQHSEVIPGEYVMLAVSDTGCGMSQALMERIFEPFFTTKSEGRGTGLGLSQVYGFIKQSKGHIKVYSEEGHGTTIRLYLPRALQAEQTEAEAPTGAIERGTETILVAEDDPDVRETAVDMLSELGYRVLKAVDGQSALTVVQSGMPIDLLFSDVIMPGPITAPELARQAKRVQPDMAVLFTSGYTQNAIIHGGRLDPGVDLLGKPYSREQLARKIRHALRNREQRIAVREAQTAEKADAPVLSEATRLSILMVEDDRDILEVIFALVEEAGHEVIACTSAEKALEALERADFDVLFTDVGLPGMSGVELARHALERYPTLRVVFASGYGRSLGADDLPEANVTILPKPYNVEDVERTLQRLAATDVWSRVNGGQRDEGSRD
jgi:PAS domain S-box-containing protein